MPNKIVENLLNSLGSRLFDHWEKVSPQMKDMQYYLFHASLGFLYINTWFWFDWLSD